MQLFFNISALVSLQRMWNVLQTYGKLDIFIKPSDMIKLVKLPGNSKYHVWETKFDVIFFLLLFFFFFLIYQYRRKFPTVFVSSEQSFELLTTDL
jgi:hypothetical protein